MATKKKWELEEEEAALRAQEAVKPGAYQSKHQAAMDQLASQVLNRKEFSYDPREDGLYQQAVNRYVRQGRAAMEDTIGKAQAMTGGYGNSYAQTAAQQAYQGYLQQAAELAPEYYQLARDAYDRQGQELMDRYALVKDQETQDYGRYQDAVTAWYREMDRLQGNYDRDRQFQYQQTRDEAADRQWLADYAEKLRQNNLKKNIRKLDPDQAKTEQEAWWAWWQKLLQGGV